MTTKSVPPMTKRIWVYWNETYTKITLRQGESVDLTHAGQTDEGYYRNVETYCWEGRKLEAIFTVSWRDCDGYHRDHRRSIALANTAPHPKWVSKECRITDYTAIAANY